MEELNSISFSVHGEDVAIDMQVVKVSDIEDIKSEIKRQAITELLEQHKKDRAKVSSKSDLINMSTVEKYLDSLCE